MQPLDLHTNPDVGRTSFLYLDESGDFNFSPNGSKYFILTGVVMERPFPYIFDLARVKYDCLEDPTCAPKYEKHHKFHACEDAPAIRNKVFNVIQEHIGSIRIYTAIVQKNKVRPENRHRSILYRLAFESVANSVFSNELFEAGRRLIIITDTLPVEKKRSQLRSALKRFSKSLFEDNGIGYWLYHHESASDVNLQVADYCCWAINRKWASDELLYYEKIEPAVVSERLFFADDAKVYYEYDLEVGGASI